MKILVDYFSWICEHKDDVFTSPVIGNKIVYLYYDKDYLSAYIGRGNENRDKRHRNDLFSKVYKNWNGIVLHNLSDKASKALEAWLIIVGNTFYGLRTSENVMAGRLLNKKREKSQEVLIQKWIKHGDYFADSVSWKTNDN